MYSGLEVTVFQHCPDVWHIRCTTCANGCVGMGWCPGDALARLPCKAAERLGRLGLSFPDWKEALRDDEAGSLLV